MQYNRVYLMLVPVMMLSCISPAFAQYHIYLTATGEKQGDFKAGKGKSNNGRSAEWLPVAYLGKLSVDDIKTGSAKRPHHPIVITRETDLASPQLFQACTNGEILKDVVIECTKMAGKKEVVFKTIHLKDGLITSMVKDPDHHTEEIHLNYLEMELHNLDPSTSATDDVTANNQ